MNPEEIIKLVKQKEAIKKKRKSIGKIASDTYKESKTEIEKLRIAGKIEALKKYMDWEKAHKGRE